MWYKWHFDLVITITNLLFLQFCNLLTRCHNAEEGRLIVVLQTLRLFDAIFWPIENGTFRNKHMLRFIKDQLPVVPQTSRTSSQVTTVLIVILCVICVFIMSVVNMVSGYYWFLLKLFLVLIFLCLILPFTPSYSHQSYSYSSWHQSYPSIYSLPYRLEILIRAADPCLQDCPYPPCHLYHHL